MAVPYTERCTEPGRTNLRYVEQAQLAEARRQDIAERISENERLALLAQQSERRQVRLRERVEVALVDWNRREGTVGLDSMRIQGLGSDAPPIWQ
jgi:hypothetical protein